MISELNLYLWGKQVSLHIWFDCYPGEEILPSQLDVVRHLNNSKLDFLQNEKEMIDYMKKQGIISSNDKINDIFQYFTPTVIVIKHNDVPKIAILCDYKYDVDMCKPNGIAVVINEFKSVSIVPQDLFL